MKLMAFSCFPWESTTGQRRQWHPTSTLAWKIPWREEPARLQSMGSRRVGHDWATSLSLFTFLHWRRKWQPTPCSCLESPRDGGAWWAAIYGVTQSWTRLKRLSSSSNYRHSRDYVQTIRIVLTFLQNFFFHYNMKNSCVLGLQILFLRLNIIKKGFWY